MDLPQFCAAHGIVLDAMPPLGLWRRYKTLDKPRHRNGAVKYLGTHAFVQNHATMPGIVVWKPDADPAPDELARIRQQLREQEDRDRRARDAAIGYVRTRFAELPRITGPHPYIEAKGLSMRGTAGMRVDGEWLVVPMRRDGRLMSWQRISPSGEKLFKKYAPPDRSIHVIGHDRAPLTVLCEGVATGLAIYQCLEHVRVVVAFTAGNLVKAAQDTHIRGSVVIAADNDHETAAGPHTGGVNPGLQAANEAAQVLGCQIAYPDGVAGSDWADALREWGASTGPIRLRMQITGKARVVMR